MSYPKQARGPFKSVPKRIPEGAEVYLPVLLVTALAGLFILHPIAQAVYSSSSNKDLLASSGAEFIGLANCTEIWSNLTVHQVLWNTLIWAVVGSSTAIVLGFLMGWLLHEKLPYTSVVSAIVLTPRIPPRVVDVSIWQFTFGGSQDIINELLVQLGIIDEYTAMFGSTEFSLWSSIIGMIWQLVPLFALLTLTSLQGIDEHLYEAARMDGATPWGQSRFTTIPMMRYNPVIGFFLMLIYNIRNFSMAWVMMKGGPDISSSMLSIMIYRTAFVNLDVGLASALSLILFVVLPVSPYYYIQVYDQVRDDA